MNLEDKSMKELLELHNSMADVPAGPKTFSTKSKLLARVRALAEAKGVSTKDFAAKAAANASNSRADTDHADIGTEPSGAPEQAKKRGLGIGELARVLLMDPAGFPHSLIAAMVNAQIDGATATDKSVRWYAAKMRKEGLDVPQRAKAFPTEMSAEQSKEWLAPITVAKEGDK